MVNLRGWIKRLERARHEERHTEAARAEFVADIQEFRRLIETGEPSETHRIVGQDRNEVAGPIPDLSE
jgi:hypothetical protein